MKPSNFSLPRSTTAWKREIVAIEPLSWYSNGPLGALPASERLIASAEYRAPWMATWATPGSLFSEIMSPTTCTSGWPGSVRSGSTATRPARSTSAPDCSPRIRPSGLACTPAAQIFVAALIRRDLAVGVLDLDAVGVDVGHHRAELDLDADLVELAAGAAAELLAERRQHVGGGVEQDDAGGGRVDAAEVAAQGAVGELGDLAGHLHPGGAGADDDEGEQPVDLLLRLGELGQLEGAEDAAAQLEGVVDALHAGGELGEPVVAEVGLAGAGRDDQLVVGVHGDAAQDVRRDRAGGEVDVGDLTEHDAGVLVPADDLAGRRGDLALGEDAGGHLVEQRLEEVVAGLADQRDVDGRLAQRLRREQPAESGADDDDTRPPGGGVACGRDLR